MIIDRKFKFVVTNPCKGTVYTEENAIIFLAKDEAVPTMLFAYQAECERLGCGPEHIESVELLIGRVLKYQQDIESHIPDTETPCEIERSIGGEV